jgi:hypothetical protein
MTGFISEVSISNVPDENLWGSDSATCEPLLVGLGNVLILASTKELA